MTRTHAEPARTAIVRTADGIVSIVRFTNATLATATDPRSYGLDPDSVSIELQCVGDAKAAALWALEDWDAQLRLAATY